MQEEWVNCSTVINDTTLGSLQKAFDKKKKIFEKSTYLLHLGIQLYIRAVSESESNESA